MKRFIKVRMSEDLHGQRFSIGLPSGCAKRLKLNKGDYVVVDMGFFKGEVCIIIKKAKG